MPDVPVAILCGGKGTRLGAGSVPKALVEVGGKPILWHVMNIYRAAGFERFILCLGHGSDLVREAVKEGFEGEITCLETGEDTHTGGRIKAVEGHVDSTFMATYADGLAEIDVRHELEVHRSEGRYSTIACPRARNPFGVAQIADGAVTGFVEKPLMQERINGGFFVFEPEVFGYLTPTSILEREPFEKLAGDSQMTAYPLDGFWACMDTYKDALELTDLWHKGAPWTGADR